MDLPCREECGGEAGTEAALTAFPPYKKKLFSPPTTSLFTSHDDLRKDYIESMMMVWTNSLLTAFVALLALCTFQSAKAVLGSFEIVDLCVDSPFQANVTSTANSTISCKL
jgi:hypothetical protein